MPQPLTDEQRKAIHNLALDARELLTRETRELLEGTYGLYLGGRLDPPGKLPQVQADPETGETYRRLAQFLQDEEQAGLPRPEAVDKLVKEVAFTHLNRLVAFKMMEARKLIRGTVDRGSDSNAFKFYLADPDHAGDYALYQAGDVDGAYRHFLLWQSAQIAAEVRVLFDPDTLPSRLYPRLRALHALLDMLNQRDLTDAWQADETIGWIYQYFSEPEREEWSQRREEKVPPEIVPLKTQLFTPHWVVRFLVQNTLGRLWVQMHPDTRLAEADLLDYLVPLEGKLPPEPLRLIREITLLDPACGTMHFGLVAFELFAAMYQEELDRAGEPGWPKTSSVGEPAEIPAAIVEHNLYGIDIDLRAVQLSALALYLKAKTLDPKARITDSNLACADVRPLNGARLGAFVREVRFARPVYERLIRALWRRLQDVNQLGSLLRLERELEALIAEERLLYEQQPLFAGVSGQFEKAATEEEFWNAISGQIVKGLDEFARQQAGAGVDQTFFVGEAAKGLHLLHLLLERYDVVVTNPPYLDSRVYNPSLMKLIGREYPASRRNLYAAFVERCLELLSDGGRLGILTGQSFMFISSFAELRERLLEKTTIGPLLQFDYHLFDDARMDTACYVLRHEPETLKRLSHRGVYFRLVHGASSQEKRRIFQQALRDERNSYTVVQCRFDAIPGSPWVYWIPETIRRLFEALPKLGEVAQLRQGLATGDNVRFIRHWWEVGVDQIVFGCRDCQEAHMSGRRWFPYLKGGPFRRWYGNQGWVIAFDKSHFRILSDMGNRLPSRQFYFREGVTYSYLTSATFSARLSSGGFIFDVAGSSAFPNDIALVLAILNSKFAAYALRLINPTVNFQVGDLARLPMPTVSSSGLYALTRQAVAMTEADELQDEATFSFIVPPRWGTGLDDLAGAQACLTSLESQIDDEVYHLYGISDEDRVAIEAELAGEPLTDEDDTKRATHDTDDLEEPEPPMTVEELAVRWISYAVGVVLGRFQPGVPGALGCAVYRRADFAAGSLPEPDEIEFDELVGPPERFAYVDPEGGRHLFSAHVEAALRDLALSDGIAVLDEGHPRDLPTLVEKALHLMLDGGDETPNGTRNTQHATRNTQHVLQTGANGDLRKFLERDFFAKWHLKWYRKRLVYWPLQSARRGYGFVLFHEQIDRSTLYVLQRDYLDHKLNGLRLEIGDLQSRLEGLSGSARRQVERQIDQAAQLLDEVNGFAQTMERIVREGYEPEPDWIDDGVILRMAPLWELIPIWKSEPQKYWERLQGGDYDWSHIAMRYWPERVREACKVNKSFAIAHGHEEWYEGA